MNSCEPLYYLMTTRSSVPFDRGCALGSAVTPIAMAIMSKKVSGKRLLLILADGSDRSTKREPSQVP